MQNTHIRYRVMALIRLESILTIYFFIQLCSSVPIRPLFEKCDTKGFTCNNSQEITGKHDITFECNTTVTGQDIQLYLWSFNAVGTITSLTIQNCDKLQLSFTCTGENKPIQWLKLKNIGSLEIMQAQIANHNPPKVFFENITKIEILPKETFGQVKKVLYKPGCIIPVTDLEEISFKNVNIGTIETAAFKNLTDMKNFEWEDVTVDKINYGAIQTQFVQDAHGSLKNCSLGVLEPMTFQIIGDAFSVKNCKIKDMWASSINGTIYDFEFIGNTVDNSQSGSIAVLSQNSYVNNNHFRNIESGAFRKISPGLLHDSNRNFGTLYFVYEFNNNVIEHVEDYGIRPDIEAYKNVASHVNYTDNILQCSCEAISWLGAEVDLGFGYSVLKDFNTMILDPTNKNKCNFNPCMCFGVRSPDKKSTVF